MCQIHWQDWPFCFFPPRAVRLSVYPVPHRHAAEWHPDSIWLALHNLKPPVPLREPSPTCCNLPSTLVSPHNCFFLKHCTQMCISVLMQASLMHWLLQAHVNIQSITSLTRWDNHVEQKITSASFISSLSLSLFRSLACSTLCVHYSAWTFIHCSSPTKSMGGNFSEALKRLRVNCVLVGWGCPERTGYLLQNVIYLINIFFLFQ